MNKSELAVERVIAKHQAIKEFEFMIEMAELRALSKYSQENHLNDNQFKRFMDLKNRLFGEEENETTNN